MSTIYLPGGGKIEIHTPWSSSSDDAGNQKLFAQDKDKTYLGIITSYGVPHLTNACKHTYYPPPINSLDDAADLVLNNIKNLRFSKLKALKKQLDQYNFKSYYWKN